MGVRAREATGVARRAKVVLPPAARVVGLLTLLGAKPQAARLPTRADRTKTRRSSVGDVANELLVPRQGVIATVVRAAAEAPILRVY